MADKFEQWGVVEIMGHQRAAGRLTEEVVAGANLLRVDAPINAHDFRTVYYGAAAIYALHVTGEEEARKMGRAIGGASRRSPTSSSNRRRGLRLSAFRPVAAKTIRSSREMSLRRRGEIGKTHLK